MKIFVATEATERQTQREPDGRSGCHQIDRVAMMRGMPTIIWLVKIFLALGRLPPLISYVLHLRNEAGGFNGKPEQFFLEPTIVGKRYALCVGIDDYPEPNTLSGCVGDANDWEAFFRTQGVAVTKLTDGDATLKAILEGMRDVTQNAVAGDIVAIQYSGHGTTVPDSSGDEPDGNDEALVPFDFDSSGFLIDDDIGAVFDEAPSGVALNIFFDCCHSGTATRLLVSKKKMRALGEKARYLAATPEERATGVWIAGGAQARLIQRYGGRKVETALHRVVDRGGIVAGYSAGAAVLSRVMIRAGTSSEAVLDKGFGLLHHVVIDTHFSQRARHTRLFQILDEYPNLIAIGVDETSAVIFRQNQLRVMGDARVTVMLSRGEDRPVIVHQLRDGQDSELKLIGSPFASGAPTVELLSSQR